MAIRPDDDIDTLKEKLTRSLTNVYTREGSSIPRERIAHGCRMYVDSRLEEYERISNLSDDAITHSKTYIKTSKYHLSQLQKGKYTWPENWQVYATHFSCETVFKATAKIQGIEVDDHQYIEAAVKMFDQGKLKHLFNAFQAIGIITGDIPNLSQRVKSFRDKYTDMVRRQDDYARASEHEIASIIRQYYQFKREFSKAYQLSEVRKLMTVRFDRAMNHLFSHYSSLARHVKFQIGATRLTRNVAWPVEMDALMAGVLLYPHRNSTRYGQNLKRRLEPSDYCGINPPGIVSSLDALCKMVQATQSRVDLDIKDIEELRTINQLSD